MATTTLTRQQVIEAEEELRPILESHETIYAVVKHVSRSGMSRVIDFYVIEANGLRRISHLVAAVYNQTWQTKKSRGWTYSRGGVNVHGCGMDVGWYAIHSCRCHLALGEPMADSAVHDYAGRPVHLGYGFRIEYL